MHKCPGCGLTAGGELEFSDQISASHACLDRYHQVVGFEAQHLQELGQWHQLIVDAYGAQHPLSPTPQIRVYYSIVGLMLALERGQSGLQVRDAHRRMGKPQAWWPSMSCPATRGDFTIDHVARCGADTANLEKHQSALLEWAESVWRAWAAQREPIIALAQGLRLI